jgi:hypothetical protein
MIIPLRQKYMRNQVKKQGASGDDQGKHGGRKRVRKPAPVSRQRTLHLVDGRKLRFEG